MIFNDRPPILRSYGCGVCFGDQPDSPGNGVDEELAQSDGFPIENEATGPVSRDGDFVESIDSGRLSRFPDDIAIYKLPLSQPCEGSVLKPLMEVAEPPC